jgi:ATP/maltotriose-dependent transcriptional regulator MalT/DNA-binding SARP family transcriptional activator
MGKKATAPTLAKITRPKLSGVFKRERLFHLIDRSLRKPVIWIAAPAGSGKTTLIASYLDAHKLPCLWYQVDERDGDLASFYFYLGLAVKNAAPRYRKPMPLLTPEYLDGINTFTRQYFEELFRRLKPPSAVVFDNYQDVPDHSGFHEMIANALDVIPDKIQVYVLSRTDPPPQLTRLQANNQVSLARWDEIRFTMDESRNLIDLKGNQNISDEALELVYRKTEGWAAGLVLLKDHMASDTLSPNVLGQITSQGIFDYFASELIDKTDSKTRNFLLKTAFLPKMTALSAKKLTGISGSGQILERLSRGNFFTTKHLRDEASYQYHPLFREFLLFRARNSFDQKELSGIMRNAAGALNESGDIDDAASLYMDNRDWDELAGLALDNAQSLLAQGRNRTLDQWLSMIPSDIFSRTPWLLYWQGVCKMPFDINESRECLEKAYGLFKKNKNPSGIYLSWSWIIDTYVYHWSDNTGMEHWIEEIESVIHEYPEFPTPEIRARVTAGMFYALMHRRPDHPDLPLWKSRLREILLKSTDMHFKTTVSSHLVLYYTWWSGDQTKADFLLRTLRPERNLENVPPLIFIAWRAIEGAHQYMAGHNERSLESSKEGRAIAESADIHLWDFLLFGHGVFVTLSEGDLEAARAYLDKMKEIFNTNQYLAVARYHYQLSWEALCLNNLALALDHAKTGLKITIEAEMPALSVLLRTAVVDVLISSGEYKEALKYLDEARDLAVRYRTGTLEYQVLWLEAVMHFNQGDRKSGLESLRKYLQKSRELGICGHSFWRTPVMMRLFAIALDNGIEEEQVHEIIRRRRLVPDESMAEIENWPWPVKIYTLGKFVIKRDGKQVSFTRKVQKKTLELLKAVIALGGEDVRAEQITDLLWPDADGDSAHNSFKMTLSRLRQLIGSDAVIYQEGRTSINKSLVWTDSRAFYRMCDRVENEWKSIKKLKGREKDAKRRTEEAIALFEKALGMYRGTFLPDDATAWALLLRERLRNRYLKIVAGLGEHYEHKGKLKTAVDVYLKGIEADRLTEEFYQRLMLCYQKLGQQAEAISIYNLCRAKLSSGLGIEPSRMTESIYASIRK